MTEIFDIQSICLGVSYALGLLHLKGYGGLCSQISRANRHVVPFLDILNHGANISLTGPYWWAVTIYFLFHTTPSLHTFGSDPPLRHYIFFFLSPSPVPF